VNVNRGAEGSSEVGGARGDETEMVVMGELGNSFNVSGSLRESSEDLSDVSTLLHGDNSELILFVDPHEEGLRIVVEDTSSLRPVSVEATGFKETVTLLKEEMVVNELLAVFLAERSQRVVSALEFSIEAVACLGHLLFDLFALLAGDSWSKRELSKVATNSDASGADHLGILLREGRSVELGVVHVAHVFVSRFVTVVVLDDLIEQVFESCVGVMTASVHTDARVDVLGAGEDGVAEGETVLIL